MKKIDKLAHLAVKRGVGTKRSKIFNNSTIESLPLVRKIAEHAYKEGAHIVTPIFTDSDITLRALNMLLMSLLIIQLTGYLKEWGKAFDTNTARMAIAGDDPMLLSEMDPDKVHEYKAGKSLQTSKRGY